MLLTIDIGNTTTKLALFEGQQILERARFPTIREESPAKIANEVKLLTSETLTGIAISSVVRELRGTYKQFGSEFFDVEPLFADHTSNLGFTIDYNPPEDCGPDRLVAASAAVEKAGSPVIVCDFGTATTIDLVDDKKIYKGGIIAPGIETMANSLFEKTSRLPKVKIRAAIKVVGDSTVGSIQSGIYFGYIGLVDGIIERMQAGYDSPVAVVSTGGYAELISGSSVFVDEVEPDLIHLGLRSIWKRLAT